MSFAASLIPRILVSALPLAAACTDPAADDRAGEAAAGAAVVDGAAEAAVIGGWYTDTAGLAGAAAAVPEAEARALLTGNTARAITAAVTAPACVAVDSDQATYVAATFTACTGPGGRGGLSGTVRGELGLATTPCGPAQCPTALTWTMTADLTWGDGGALAGAWTIDAPLATTAPRTLTGALTATARDGASATSQATASWTRAADDCVALDAQATLTGAAAGDLTVTGLAACPGACPTAGAVVLQGARGALAWSYGAGATVTVTAGDRSFALPLACAR
ncbi:MAG: hypothetical protein IPH44_01430 [Myxococcales bacterium]|nr:hypothetical protein [Myxococcales bacterium]MBK7197977.1 hypothetical protein [Myxococcales bacterium]MBP6845319.1 hypothetical protein [Kofleriaceae bacterium]